MLTQVIEMFSAFVLYINFKYSMRNKEQVNVTELVDIWRVLMVDVVGLTYFFNINKEIIGGIH